ncbi:MAG TPA: carbohydrate phosphatase [Firmicutes bacterium]|nr:carbohydrate phosphatase [Bacillota bacterium]
MQPKTEAVIFDMDGLMFDSEKIACACWKKAAAQYGYQINDELFLKTLGQTAVKNKKVYTDSLGADFPFEAAKKIRLQLGVQYFQTHGVPVKDGLIELLTYLKSRHFKTAVATSTFRENAVPIIKQAGVFDFFNIIVCGDEITKSKPDPEIFLKAASILEVPPEKCIVLEDSESGISAASKAGMKPILIPDLKEACDEVKALAFRQFRSLLQVVKMLEEE